MSNAEHLFPNCVFAYVHLMNRSVGLTTGFCDSVFLKERLLIADMALAGCEFMFEETRNYVRQRKAFGKTVAHLQVSLNRETCKADA